MNTKHFLFLLIPPLILLMYCHSPCINDVHQQASIVANDTLFVPTGDAKLDSLLSVASSRQDTVLGWLYYDIGERYQDNDFEKAKDYYLKLKDLSEQIDWNKGRYLYSTGYSLILAREGLTDSAIVINLQAFDLAKKEKNERWMSILNINIGNAYLSKEWFETALQYYMEGLSYFEKINDTEKKGNIYQKIAQVYKILNLIEKAIEFGEKAVALHNDDPYASTTLGLAYANARSHEKARFYYQEALRMCERQNNTYLMEYIYYLLCASALDMYDLDNAAVYLGKMRDISGDKMSFDVSYLVANGKMEALRGHFSQAEKYALQALEIAIEQGAITAKKNCYLLLCELTLAQGRFRENTLYRDELDLVEKTLANETSVRSAAEMEARYENEKKQLEIERQQQIIAQQNMQRWLLAVGVIILVVFLSLLWYMLRLRIRRNLALAERNDALTERNDALTERNDALSEINATKDKFFNIISHDLKNPTLAMHDNLKLLVSHVHDWNLETLSDFSNELLKSTEGQVELLHSLLNWARIQTGRFTCTPVAFDLATHLRTDILLVRKMAENKGITFVTQMPDDLLVTGDANLIVTVIRNLLTNAIKFTAPSGTVTLSITPTSPTSISITDTGTSMTPEQIANLFRLDKPQTRRGTAGEEGSGLGLIVCKELLEMHNSTLHVESEQGQGSRFWFVIPA